MCHISNTAGLGLKPMTRAGLKYKGDAKLSRLDANGDVAIFWPAAHTALLVNARRAGSSYRRHHFVFQ